MDEFRSEDAETLKGSLSSYYEQRTPFLRTIGVCMSIRPDISIQFTKLYKYGFDVDGTKQYLQYLFVLDHSPWR